MQKKKRIGQMFFVLATCCTLNSHGRGEYCSPAKNHKVTFLIVFFSLVRKERKGKKRKELTPVSATPTHMLRICVNPSFKHLLSPRGDRCEQSAPTVRQLLNHGYRFETLKRRLGFTAVPCQAMANLAVKILAKVWVRT